MLTKSSMKYWFSLNTECFSFLFSVSSFFIEHMNDCKDLYDALNKPPKQRSEIRYIQWIAETKDKVEHVLHKDPKIPRLLHACFRHLEVQTNIYCHAIILCK